jgi:hypothetical protein
MAVIDAIGEEEGVEASPVTAPGPEAEEPKAARRVIADINRDCALEHFRTAREKQLFFEVPHSEMRETCLDRSREQFRSSASCCRNAPHEIGFRRPGGNDSPPRRLRAPAVF